MDKDILQHIINRKSEIQFLRKTDIHKYMWTAKGLGSIRDYIIVNSKLRNQIQDIRV